MADAQSRPTRTPHDPRGLLSHPSRALRYRHRQVLPGHQECPPLTTDEGVIIPNTPLVQALIAQLRVILQVITDFDQAIAQRAQSHHDFSLFAALPGAGAVFAPRLRGAFRAQRERYASAAELQKYAGIAPVT